MYYKVCSLHCNKYGKLSNFLHDMMTRFQNNFCHSWNRLNFLRFSKLFQKCIFGADIFQKLTLLLKTELESLSRPCFSVTRRHCSNSIRYLSLFVNYQWLLISTYYGYKFIMRTLFSVFTKFFRLFGENPRNFGQFFYCSIFEKQFIFYSFNVKIPFCLILNL